MTRAAEILSPDLLARIARTCDALGLKGRDRDVAAGLCQIARVEGYIAGIDEGRGILKGAPKRDNVVDFDIEKLARRFEGVGDRPSDSGDAA